MLKVFSKISKGLEKTKTGLVDSITTAVRGKRISQNVLDELEEILILCDVGVATSEKIINDLFEKSKNSGQITEQEIKNILKEDLTNVLLNVSKIDKSTLSKPHVISVVGVNGTGKTTTIGKLAYKLSRQGNKVLLAAADTFRAGAINQLEIWAKRSNTDIVQNLPGADPASVAYDALKAAIAREIDILVIDTAGRLHTKTNLMAELSKIHRVLKKQRPDAPHEILLVLDATTGQNGLSQAKQFTQMVDVTGIVLTKLDGTAKGGIIFSIANELKIPVKYIGLGEKIDDLADFEPHSFVEALFQ